jgi:2-succinyl-5-enolpyruvyl-6-hydroxy-3-cyclohexene-1-carboxylate synthase
MQFCTRLATPMDTTNANTALASAFAEELGRGGLRRAVISPGSRSTPLALALWRQPEIEVSVIVDERSAGFFALGAAQASGEPVALLCTSGTALVNYHPAVVEGDESAIPLLVLSADRPPELRGIGAGQTIDQIKTFGSSVRWFCEVGTHTADDDGLLHYRSTACRALAAARGETRPGPVHLNLPWREPLAPLPVPDAVTATDPLALEGREGRPLTAVTRLDLEPSAFLLDEVAGHIGNAIGGVIVAGRQLDPELREPLAHLARVAGFPILADPTSQLRCGPHDRSHVVAAYDLLLREEHFARSVVPDLVLRFGEMPTSKPLRAWLTASGADEIVIDPYGGWNEPTRRAAAILRADPTELASGWAARLERLEGRERPAPERWTEAEAAAQAALSGALDGEGEITEPALHRALGEAHRDGDLVYTASSMPIRDQEAFLAPGKTDALFLSNRGANGIDGTVSTAFGAAAAAPHGPAVLLVGDVALAHDVGGLLAATRLSLKLTIVVIDNDGGGIFAFLPVSGEGADYVEHVATPHGLDTGKIAELYGIGHERAEDLDGFRAALDRALAADRTTIVAVRTERDANVALHRKVWDAVSGSVRAGA